MEGVRLSLDAMSRVYHVMVTVAEMCSDRGYILPNDWCPKSLDDFRESFVKHDDTAILREKMILVCSRERGGDVLMVMFKGEAALTTKDVKDCISHAQSDAAVRVKNLILVTAGKINAITRKYIDAQGKDADSIQIQVFEEDDLIVNITHHELVPKHELLSDAAAQQMLAAFSLKASQLPRILSRDPVSLYFGVRKGQIFKITRKSETAGEYTTYRLVV